MARGVIKSEGSDKSSHSELVLLNVQYKCFEILSARKKTIFYQDFCVIWIQIYNIIGGYTLVKIMQ